MTTFWKTVHRLGENLVGITVKEVRQASLVFFGVSSITVIFGGAVYLSGNSTFGLSLIFSIPVVFASLFVYFIGTFFVTDFLNWSGKKLVQRSKIASSKLGRAEIKYSFKQFEDKVYLRIHSSKRNHKLLLRLDFFTPEPRWLINEQTRNEIQMKFLNVNDKLMYWNQDLMPDTIIQLPDPVAKITEDYLVLFADGNGGRWEIPIPFGRYIYNFREQVTHKESGFGKMRKFTIEVKEGKFTYEEIS